MSSPELGPLFEPASIAVIGATDHPEKAGSAMMQALGTFKGQLYPINPNAESVAGHTAYPTVKHIGEPVDLAVIVIPPKAVPGAIRDCIDSGVRAAVICTGGFAESGDAGAALQDEIADLVRGSGLRLLGPNTSGFMNPGSHVTANFMPAVRELHDGKVAVVAQSGGVNLAISFLLDAAGVGLRLGVGLGNAIDVDFADIVDYLATDSRTTAIALHVEGVSDGPAFLAAIRRASGHKPVVAFKVGRNDVGDFARSHTGAMTGSYEVTRQALREAGAVVVDTLTDLVDAVHGLSNVRIPAKREPGVGIVTGQAGPGLIIADTLASRSATVPALRQDSINRLGELLPPLTYQSNPVDTGRPSATFPDVLRAVSTDPAIDVIALYALDEPGVLDPADAIRNSTVPVLMATGGPREVLDARSQDLEARSIPMFASPDRLAVAVAAVIEDARLRARQEGQERSAGRQLPVLDTSSISESAAKQYLSALGLSVPESAVAGDRDEARRVFEALTAPIVVKVVDPAVLHKTDAGGVHLGVKDAAALDDALSAIDAIPGDTSQRKYLLEEQIGDGFELIVGAVRDPVFGPVVMLSIGGVMAELAADPVLRLAPLTHQTALDAVDQLPQSVLTGFRGLPPVDRDALATILVAVGDTIEGYPQVQEIDLNPVRITARGPIILDALILTESE